MRLPFLLSLLVLLSRCSTPETYHQHPLAYEIISPRPGHDGKLTNQACVKYNYDGHCEKWVVLEYDLSDPAFQEQADRLNITCHIGGKQYKICKNEKDKDGKPMAGFCRFTYESHCFLFICGKETRKVEYFPVSPYQAVLDSGARCYNFDMYPWEAK